MWVLPRTELKSDSLLFHKHNKYPLALGFCPDLPSTQNAPVPAKYLQVSHFIQFLAHMSMTLSEKLSVTLFKIPSPSPSSPLKMCIFSS